MNRAYALNRDKLKCKVCGGWLISATPWAHRINPNLPLDKVNRVNNLVSLHKKCFIAVNNPSQDISEFDVKAQKKNFEINGIYQHKKSAYCFRMPLFYYIHRKIASLIFNKIIMPSQPVHRTSLFLYACMEFRSS